MLHKPDISRVSDTVLSLGRLGKKGLGIIVLLFVLFKILNPQWVLVRHIGIKLAPVARFLAGALQGVTGLSAPISLSFFNAMRLERSEFIATIAVFFGLTALPQITLLIYFDTLRFFLEFSRFIARAWIYPNRAIFGKEVVACDR